MADTISQLSELSTIDGAAQLSPAMKGAMIATLVGAANWGVTAIRMASNEEHKSSDLLDTLGMGRWVQIVVYFLVAFAAIAHIYQKRVGAFVSEKISPEVARGVGKLVLVLLLVGGINWGIYAYRAVSECDSEGHRDVADALDGLEFDLPLDMGRFPARGIRIPIYSIIAGASAFYAGSKLFQ